MGQSTLQSDFFKLIKEQLPNNISLVDEVADLMGLSNDSAYRRIRGETELSFEEIKALSNHFRISLDGVVGASTDTVNFNFQEINETEYSYLDYMKSVYTALEQIKKATDKEIIFTANDIPFFHLYHVPEVAAFKSFVWQKTVLSYEEMKGKKFSLNVIEDNVNEVSRHLKKAYNTVPSTEIFHPGTIDMTLNQIEYYSVAGLFKNWKDAMLICDKLHELMDHLEKQAETGTKFSPGEKVTADREGNYTLYYNDVFYINDAVLVKADNLKMVYLIVMTLNTLTTHSGKFFQDFYNTVQNVISKSTLISGTAEKERSRVFMNYHKKIDRLKTRIES